MDSSLCTGGITNLERTMDCSGPPDTSVEGLGRHSTRGSWRGLAPTYL